MCVKLDAWNSARKSGSFQWVASVLSPGLSDSACESFKDCLPVWYSIVSIMDIKSFGFQSEVVWWIISQVQDLKAEVLHPSLVMKFRVVSSFLSVGHGTLDEV